MRPGEGAADRVAPAGTAGQTRESPPSIDDLTAERKLPALGTCIACGAHIRLTAASTTCPTCSAWRRWYVAHRIASRYLREVAR